MTNISVFKALPPVNEPSTFLTTDHNVMVPNNGTYSSTDSYFTTPSTMTSGSRIRNPHKPRSILKKSYLKSDLNVDGRFSKSHTRETKPFEGNTVPQTCTYGPKVYSKNPKNKRKLPFEKTFNSMMDNFQSNCKHLFSSKK